MGEGERRCQTHPHLGLYPTHLYPPQLWHGCRDRRQPRNSRPTPAMNSEVRAISTALPQREGQGWQQLGWGGIQDPHGTWTERRPPVLPTAFPALRPRSPRQEVPPPAGSGKRVLPGDDPQCLPPPRGCHFLPSFSTHFPGGATLGRPSVTDLEAAQSDHSGCGRGHHQPSWGKCVISWSERVCGGQQPDPAPPPSCKASCRPRTSTRGARSRV